MINSLFKVKLVRVCSQKAWGLKLTTQ